MHHAQMCEDSCFVTLTYNDEHVPADGSLNPYHFTNFMKRLRPRIGNPIEYFMCGEYGENLGRPHYHALLFGLNFPDRKLHSRTKAGQCIYVSDALSGIWGHGFASIGAVTMESAAYCARYTFKKIYGSKASKHYTRIDPQTGEITRLRGEYVRMSLKRPIGKKWLINFKSDVYPSDEVIVGESARKPPSYYDKQLSEAERTPIKEKRKAFAKLSPDNTQARLDAREECKLAQIKQLKRNSL